MFQSIVSNKCLTREREQAVSSELTLEQYLLSLQQPKRKRGIPGFIKCDLMKILKIDPDIGPKRARKFLINNRKEREKEGEHVYEEKYIAELNKVIFHTLTCVNYLN